MVFKLNPKLNKNSKSGSAMILTMFILAGMLIVAMGGSYVILIGIKAGTLQGQSTKAYYSAESGAEDILWQIRSNNLQQDVADISETAPCLTGDVSSDQGYEVYFTNNLPRTYLSVGDSKNTKRGVEVSW